MPTLASITSPDDKILICTQNGFEWVSVNNKEDQYLTLAKQLQLDIESLFPELSQEPATESDSPHGKCALCFHKHSVATALPSAEFGITKLENKPVVYLFVAEGPIALGEYESPQPRAPPVFFI